MENSMKGPERFRIPQMWYSIPHMRYTIPHLCYTILQLWYQSMMKEGLFLKIIFQWEF